MPGKLMKKATYIYDKTLFLKKNFFFFKFILGREGEDIILAKKNEAFILLLLKSKEVYHQENTPWGSRTPAACLEGKHDNRFTNGVYITAVTFKWYGA